MCSIICIGFLFNIDLMFSIISAVAAPRKSVTFILHEINILSILVIIEFFDNYRHFTCALKALGHLKHLRHLRVPNLTGSRIWWADMELWNLTKLTCPHNPDAITIFQTNLNWIGTSESSWCPSLVTIIFVEQQFLTFQRETLEIFVYLLFFFDIDKVFGGIRCFAKVTANHEFETHGFYMLNSLRSGIWNHGHRVHFWLIFFFLMTVSYIKILKTWISWPNLSFEAEIFVYFRGFVGFGEFDFTLFLETLDPHSSPQVVYIRFEPSKLVNSFITQVPIIKKPVHCLHCKSMVTFL